MINKEDIQNPTAFLFKHPVSCEFGEVVVDDRKEETRVFVIDRNNRIYQVDIFDSIRKNPTSIGHPVILAAIHYWTIAIEYNKKLKIDKDRNALYKKALRNLNLLSQALIEGAQTQALLPSAAWYLSKQLQDSLDLCLKIVWETMGKKQKTKTTEKKINRNDLWLDSLIEAAKKELYNQGHISEEEIAIDEGYLFLIRIFLESDEGAYYRRSRKRGKWIVFKNAYDAQIDQLGVETVRKYRREVEKRPEILGKVRNKDRDDVFNELLGQATYTFNDPSIWPPSVLTVLREVSFDIINE